MSEITDKIEQKELLSMKEFSVFTGIGQPTLRYWDDIGLFSPSERNPNSGYRYYSPLQIIAINFISVLSTLGIPLKSIGLIESARTPKKILEMLEQHENILDMEMRRLRESYSIIHTRRGLIRLGFQGDEAELSVCALEETPIILGQRNDFGDDNNFYGVFMRFCDEAKPRRMNLGYPIGGYFETMGDFLKTPGKPTRFFTVDPTGYEKRKAGEYLVGYTRGYYGDMKDLPKRMKAYAREHSLTFSGPVYVIYLHDELSITDPEQYLARVIAGVSREEEC